MLLFCAWTEILPIDYGRSESKKYAYIMPVSVFRDPEWQLSSHNSEQRHNGFYSTPAYLYIKLQTQNNKKKILCAYTYTHSVCMYSQNPNVSESERLDIHFERAYVYMNYTQPCNLLGSDLISLATLTQHQHMLAIHRERSHCHMSLQPRSRIIHYLPKNHL